MMPLVKRLGFVAMNVVDLDAATRDTQDIAGARLIERNGERAVLSSNARRAELVFYKSESNAARSIGLEVDNAAAVDEALERARTAGLTVVTEQPSLEFIDRAFSFLTSEDHLIEVHTRVPHDQPRRFLGPGIHPKCIDHVNLVAVDPAKIAGELQEVLGMQISERTLGREVSWLRAADGRHHTIGMVKGPRAGIHHFSWEFDSFEDFRRLGDLLDAEGRALIWGPGRHGAGDNIFSYYFDAAGFMVECTSDMETIHDLSEPTRVVDAGAGLSNPKVVNKWGTPPSPVWVQHHTAFAKPALSEA